MEEEVAAKVTRLRRRLSVEADDVKSPSAPSTPTKKRGGRLAAKPQLELIDENAIEAVPKRTRKSTIKDIVEPADDKVVTPSRRSTRVRSNTSTLSESQTGVTLDEKPMTPARRSARIRSNTSLVSETTQSYDSPRAKRAARRTSQVGSDTETSTTPARQARRTRKDSSSTVDKADINTAKVGSPIKEVVVEEVEIQVKETNNNNTPNSDPHALRKSPRLIDKVPRKSTLLDNDDKENQPQSDKESSTIDNDMQVEPIENIVSSSAVNVDAKPNEVESKNSDLKNLSITSAKLIEQMDTENRKNMSKMNKTTSIVEDSKEFKSKRHRTKSCTTISVPVPNDGSFYSDSEVAKKKNKRASNHNHVGNNSGSGDGILNLNSQTNTGKEDELENLIPLSTSNSSAKKKKRLSEKSLINSEMDQSYINTTSSKTIDKEQIVTEIKNYTQEHEALTATNNLSGPEKLFEETPSGVVQTLVYIEDSDSNTGSTGKENMDKQFNDDDQCLPVIKHQLVLETSKHPNNTSCEPMDIDETINENSSIILLEEKDISMKREDQGKREKPKSSICVPNEENSISKISNKSKRKSSIGNAESQILDKTNNENKSTLVLSQIKDISTNEEAVSINSAANVVNINEPLSKSFNVNESDKNKNIDKGNLSLTYSTSTPLQQKSLKKLGMQINTSIITPNNKKEIATKLKNETAMLSESDDSNSEDEIDGIESETSEEKNKLIIDEAEEASDDYESGDSRDKEEREYEENNEIKERGETLNSDDEDEYSDDSDYEKGSFIVSCDEEDDNLLSGSGDDLDMSDNELSMSAKSKKKYNDRKIKEQKRASREMFQARHEFDKSVKNMKPNKLKSKKVNCLESSDSEDDVNVEKKKNRRQRIDSSQDISMNVEKTLSKKKKKTRRLSDSMCEDNATSEKEITIHEDNNKDNKDPLSIQNVIKEEPKTPLKGLDISTIQVTNMEEVEEIDVDENVSMMKINKTTDPLQATTLQNEEEDDDDSDIHSISENEEITQNYDSLLDDLNKAKSKQIKTLDMSLNINKKEKQNTKEPIIDQLNLTHTKKSKKNKNSKTSISPEHKTPNKSINKLANKMDSQNEDSTDSIDMKLLFPEDSNDSDVMSAQKQNDNAKEHTDEDSKADENAKDFIPLKRTEAKTNILEEIDLSPPDKLELSASKKKNKKPNMSQTEYSASKGDKDNNDVSFFIDTTGAQDEVESNTLNKSSAKKNKNKRDSSSVTNIDHTNTTVDNAETPNLNVSIQNSGKKKKEKKKRASAIDTSDTKNLSIANEGNNKSKNSSMTNIEPSKLDLTDTNEIELDISMKNSVKKNKAQKKDTSIMGAEETKYTNIEAEDTSIVNSAKKNKKKNKKEVNSELGENNEFDTSAKVNAIKNNQNESLIAAGVDVSIKNSAKKNKKINLSLVNAEEIGQDVHIDQEEANVSIIKDDSVINEPTVVNVKKQKKKKSLDTSKTNMETQDVHEIEEIHVITDEDISQKRKRKLSANLNVEEVAIQANDTKDTSTSKSINESIATGSQKKKRKVSHNNEAVATQNEDPIEEITVKKTKKKNKHRQNVDTHQDVLPSTEKDVNIQNVEDQFSETRKVNKKRKQRDDEDEGKSSKIIKQNSFDKIHVPRLPADVLEQLDDKPKQVVGNNKKKIISTTPFLVEETIKRKNKPSNYLEQSVYLNDTLQEKKKKGSIKTPKVLPFIPTASTSDSGFTTNFRTKVIEEQPVFAQSDDVVNFKDRYLHNKKIKKLGTYEKYKMQRNIKLSKF